MELIIAFALGSIATGFITSNYDEEKKAARHIAEGNHKIQAQQRHIAEGNHKIQAQRRLWANRNAQRKTQKQFVVPSQKQTPWSSK